VIHVEVPVLSGSEADLRLRELCEANEPFPFKCGAEIDWPHALITAWRVAWGTTTYTVTQVHFVEPAP